MGNKKKEPIEKKQTKTSGKLFVNFETEGQITGIYKGIFAPPSKDKRFKDSLAIKIDNRYVTLTKGLEDKFRAIKDQLKKDKTKITILYIETIKLKGGHKFKIFAVSINDKLLENDFEYPEATL